MKNKEVRKILLNLDFRVLFKELSFENAGRMLFEVMDKYAEANSHRGIGWEQFTDAVIRAVDAQDRPIVFLLWGRPAQMKKSMLHNPKHLILEAPHPSPLSAYRGFFGCKHFRKGGKQKAENHRKREAEQQQQPELFKEEAASDDDGVPLVEAEEVEPYPFERFWNLYNFKHDKQPAEKAWNKLNNKDRAAAMAAIPNYHAYLEHKRSTGFNQNQAYAATYLNKRRWEDDYSITDTPQNYGNNNVQYNNRLAQQQQNNEVLCTIMAEAAAAVQPRDPFGTPEKGSCGI